MTNKDLDLEGVMKQFSKLTDEERRYIMEHYCECGSSDTNCQCWNEE